MAQGKRGQALENAVNYTNKIYRNKKWALVDKVPTPWTVHYDKRTKRVIRAFPKEKGTVDFIGISNGRSIAFDAKSTKERTRFPLNNIKQHQVDYLLQHSEQGGISFFIVHFEKHQETYFLRIDQLIHWWELQKEGGRRSIPHKWFKLNCDLIRAERGVPLNYLAYCNVDFKAKKGSG